MNRIFYFDSVKGNYRCDAAVFSCFDHRFDLVLREFLRKNDIAAPDIIKIAGGAKSLVSPDSEVERQFAFEQVRKSMRLHGTDRVILMVHSDCGAYGGLAAFKGDAAAEAEHHHREVLRAAQILSENIAGLDVRAYFADFEGVWEVAA
ncbi:MAG: carbonic anhydrase [Terriglobales bacterium]|jgi:carbonic anhydrase